MKKCLFLFALLWLPLYYETKNSKFCGQYYAATDAEQITFEYSGNQSGLICFWIIKSVSPVRPVQVRLADITPVVNTDCRRHNVTVYEGYFLRFHYLRGFKSRRKLGTWCGSDTTTFRSFTGFLTVGYYSDGHLANSFKLRYSILKLPSPNDCGNLTATKQAKYLYYQTSGNGTRVSCRWTITTGWNNGVNLAIVESTLTHDLLCQSDNLTFYDGNGIINTKQLGTWCGADVKTFQSETNVLTVVFSSRGDSVKRFKLRYRQTNRCSVTVKRDLNSSVLEGSSLTLNCSSDCPGPTTHTWMFQCPLGKFTYTLSSSELSGELVLNNVSSVDHGNYTCRVVHDPRSDDDVGYHGSASTSLDVIYGPDSGMRIGSKENTDQVYYWPDRNVKEEDYFHEESLYQENEAGFISCLAHCRPRCGYTWTFNGSELETWGFVSDNYVFKRKVTRYDSGEYSCTATNPTSLKSRTVNFNIVVSYGPSNSTRISKSSSAHARDTQQHIFTCSAQCVPSCSYTWKFGHAVLVSSSSDGQLSVSENSGHKTGHYTCVAVNEKTGETGAVSAFVDLDAEGEQSSGVYAGVATGVALLVVLVLVVIMLVIKNRRAEKYRAVNTNMILDTYNKTDPSKEDNQL